MKVIPIEIEIYLNLYVQVACTVLKCQSRQWRLHHRKKKIKVISRLLALILSQESAKLDMNHIFTI